MRFRLLIGLVFVALVALGGWYGIGRMLGGDADVPAVPPGDQEVAWIHVATSGPQWERFVAGVHRARRDCPRLRVDDSRAFLDQTTAVPEVVIGIDGTDARLHIRWYKLTSEADSGRWVERLARRDPPPLAFIGGGTSDRALELAKALADQHRWHGRAPLLLITTATANTIYDTAAQGTPAGGLPPELMSVYPSRSFRFCFTNQQMAEAVVDFLWTQPDLRPLGDPRPALALVPIAAAGAWSVLAPLAAREQSPPEVYSLEWDDDPYSIDLSRQFHEAFHRPGLPRVLVGATVGIPFSVGDFYRSNAWETAAADNLLAGLHNNPLERQVIVLPTAGPARRVLRALTSAMPLVGRQLVAVSGDSISVNTVYRDADIAWNVRAVPVPLVFFTHQDPVDWDESATGSRRGGEVLPSATDDVLLHCELVQLLTEAAFGVPIGPRPVANAADIPALTNDADVLVKRLRDHRPTFFDAQGDRLGGRGEFVVVLRPEIDDRLGSTLVLPSATLEVWTRGRRDTANREPGQPTVARAPGSPRIHSWQLSKRLVIHNGRLPNPAAN